MSSLKKILPPVLGMAALVFLMLYMGGVFETGVIQPGYLAAAQPTQAQPGATVQARRQAIPEYYPAVGTVRPQSQSSVAAQIAGRVLEVKVNAGDLVQKGDLLVLLESSQAQARLAQARQGLAAAQAAAQLAASEHRRVESLFAGQAATQRQREEATEAMARARAMVRQADEQVKEAQVALGYGRVLAPESGRVTRRLVDPGDLAMPGTPLIEVQTARRFRLEALVREGLIDRVSLGQEVAVDIPSLGEGATGRVAEIVPAADPQTRSFLVKVDLPAEPGVYAGMFGRLRLPVGRREAVLAPTRAITRVGQLQMVLIRTDQGWQRGLVTTGQALGDEVEVLSGLDGTETLGLAEPAHE